MEYTGRITAVHRTNCMVDIAGTEHAATVRGAVYEAGLSPCVGDMVTVERLEHDEMVITAILPRETVLERWQESKGVQTLVSNVNLILIVMGLDLDFNISRLERYLALAAQSNVPAVIVLNKADVASDLAEQQAAVAAVSGAAPIEVVTATSGAGMEALRQYFDADTIAVLLGSSGAGKSTITNWLLREERQATAATRGDDGRGRHTTTTRQLFKLPNGAAIIDTPGIRELAITTAAPAAFEKIEALATQCRFRNCDHYKSAGCAVLAAVEAGEISERELRNYHKLKQEQEWQSDNGSTTRYAAQNQKRFAQQQEQLRRRRLSGG